MNTPPILLVSSDRFTRATQNHHGLPAPSNRHVPTDAPSSNGCSDLHTGPLHKAHEVAHAEAVDASPHSVFGLRSDAVFGLGSFVRDVRQRWWFTWDRFDMF